MAENREENGIELDEVCTHFKEEEKEEKEAYFYCI